MRKIAILLSFGAALSVVACEQLTATTQAVAILTRTPDLAGAIADTALRATVEAELAKLDVTEGVIAAVGMGERETPTSTAQPDPIMGASINVSWATDNADLCEITEPGAEGTYGCTNIDTGDAAQGCLATNLAYIENQDYLFAIETTEDVFSINMTAPPPVDRTKVNFAPALADVADHYGAEIESHSLNTAMTVDWSEDADAANRHGLVVLGRLNYTGNTDPYAALDENNWVSEPNNPVFDNIPREPEGMIDMILHPDGPQVTIPAGAFDKAGLYALVITAAQLSTDVSSNLALGSGGFAGYGTVFVFWVD